MLIDKLKIYTYKDYLTFDDTVKVNIYDNLEIDFKSIDL